jgi:hypothetical protein
MELIKTPKVNTENLLIKTHPFQGYMNMFTIVFHFRWKMFACWIDFVKHRH